MSEQKYRPTPKKLIVGPVKSVFQSIHDSEGNHVCDIRGWGRLQYFKDGELLQDAITEYIVEAINEKLKRDPI